MSDIRNNGKNVKDPEPGPKPAGVGSIGHVWFRLKKSSQIFFASLTINLEY